jgi:hypothetical protein
MNSVLYALQGSLTMQHTLAQPGGWQQLLSLTSVLTSDPSLLDVMDSWLGKLKPGVGALGSVLPFTLLISLSAEAIGQPVSNTSWADEPPRKRARVDGSIIEALARRLSDGLAAYQALPTAALMSMLQEATVRAQTVEPAGAAFPQRPAQVALDTILGCLASCHRAHALALAQPQPYWEGRAIEEEFSLQGRVFTTEWTYQLRCVMRLRVQGTMKAGWGGAALEPVEATLDTSHHSLSVFVRPSTNPWSIRDPEDGAVLDTMIKITGGEGDFRITVAAASQAQLPAVAAGAPLDSGDFKYARTNLVYHSCHSFFCGWYPMLAEVQNDFADDVYLCIDVSRPGATARRYVPTTGKRYRAGDPRQIWIGLH